MQMFYISMEHRSAIQLICTRKEDMQLPAGLLKAGKNIFVVRVTNNAGKGGFVPDKPYALIAGNDTIDLKGDWQYKVGEVYPPRRFGGGGGGGISAQINQQQYIMQWWHPGYIMQ